MVGQAKLLPPEKMKHSIKLVDDQMNWCDSAMEVIKGSDLTSLVFFIINKLIIFLSMCCSTFSMI